MIFKRLIVDKIIPYLNTDDIIVLHGARQVGKTHILYYLQNYLKTKGVVTHYIDLEDSRYVTILDGGTDNFIHYLEEEGLPIHQPERGKSKLFVFIDEIQYLKTPSPFLKLMADHHPSVKLIVSGSSSFEIKNKFTESLVGRTVDFEVFNLSFLEFLIFRDYAWKKQKTYTGKKINELKKLFEEFTLYGGYPKIALTGSLAMKEKYLQQIIDTYIRKDIRDLAHIKETDKFNKLLEVLASQSGNLLNVTELSNTCNLAKQTIENYLFILEQTYIIKRLRPWSGNLRSELFKIPKIYFYDSGLMQMLWLKGLQKKILGNVLETTIFNELVKHYSKDAIFYWRTLDKKEIDFIVRIKNKIFPLEVKLNFQSFRPTAIRYLEERAQTTGYKVIGLEGRKENSHFIYPWEL
ncbi:MAG: ATP-binding protein [Candidatus Peregrinibacteria bacterium]